jgi:anaerobic magnesium-protoporphyrin IX monomethyl ester cyclase
MKIVFVVSPRAEGDLERGGLPFLGIGYVASWVEKHGYEVSMIDSHTFNWGIEKTVEAVLERRPQAVGVAATTNNRLKAIELIVELKRRNPDLFIFVGGPHFAMTAKNALKVVPEIDCVVKGEGEITTKELLDAWSNKKDFSDILGIVFRNKDKEIVETPDRPFAQDINIFSLNWDLFEMEKYQQTIPETNARAIGVISSRGCPNRCVFCVNAFFRKGILRLRDPIKFVDEVEFLKNKYGFEGFDFWDDTLTISREHIKRICGEIIKRNLKINWYAPTRANVVDREVLSWMRKAGCVRMSFGVESGSPRILKIIKKNILPEQAIEAAKLASEAGIVVVMNFMVNLPYETMDDLKMTIELMKRLNGIKNVKPAYGFSIAYPGTEMELMAKKEGWLAKDFSWNEPFRSDKYKIAGIDPSLPYLEWPGAELEKIKAIMSRELGVRGGILKKGFKKLKKIKSWHDFGSLIKAGIRYIKP